MKYVMIFWMLVLTAISLLHGWLFVFSVLGVAAGAAGAWWILTCLMTNTICDDYESAARGSFWLIITALITIGVLDYVY